MKKVLLLFLLYSTSAFAQEELVLMPWPQQINKTAGSFRITDEITVSLNGPQADDILAYSKRFVARLSGRMGMYLPNAQPNKNKDIANIKIIYSKLSRVELGMDETYSLEILPGGIILEAETQIGAMRGLETLLQMLSADAKGYYFAGYTIKDFPRFQWRGLLLDVCRHWMPMDVLLRNIDGLAAVKMNVLHLHLTEDQGFRIESKIYPKLHEMGSDGNYYTQIEMKKIISYAGARGIRVIPEFDMPGHTTSWFPSHPELASAPGPYKIERKFGVFDPTMDPTKEATYKFLKNFLTEMSALFPDEFMHIGGDENNGKQWDSNKEIQNFMVDNGLQNNHELQAYFNLRLAKILTGFGKRMVGWDEILDTDLPENIVIQSWRGKESLVEAAEAGYDGILSNGYYIDLVQSTAFHYQNDPIPSGMNISEEGKKHILGGEATMWSEIVSPETVDSRIWPRTAAIAERFWSSSSVKDINSMYERNRQISLQLEDLGLLHIKNQGMMIRRLAGKENEEFLQNLIDLIEPIEGYKRKKPSSYMPLTRIVDIAQPDALKARDFQILVGNYLKVPNPDLEDQIKEQCLQWVENDKQIKKAVKEYPVLREALPLSSDLARLGILGLQALSKTVDHTSDWKQSAMQSIELTKSPKAECEIKVISGIEMLVNGAK